jgi:hypothetical protein
MSAEVLTALDIITVFFGCMVEGGEVTLKCVLYIINKYVMLQVYNTMKEQKNLPMPKFILCNLCC